VEPAKLLAGNQTDTGQEAGSEAAGFPSARRCSVSRAEWPLDLVSVTTLIRKSWRPHSGRRMTSTITIDWTLVIAVYAAVVATATILWDFYKWKTAGPNLSAVLSTGMRGYNDGKAEPRYVEQPRSQRGSTQCSGLRLDDGSNGVGRGHASRHRSRREEDEAGRMLPH